MVCMSAIFNVLLIARYILNVAKTSRGVYDTSVNYVKLCILMTDHDRLRTLEKFEEFEMASSAD